MSSCCRLGAECQSDKVRLGPAPPRRRAFSVVLLFPLKEGVGEIVFILGIKPLLCYQHRVTRGEQVLGGLSCLINKGALQTALGRVVFAPENAE